ncbi:hypothetical protein [Nocardioides iriomotensis]|uniref:Uncharacterized protein n=1 Tax=Nocardioides iriomotensis TaxID=715784 RepID=A0A4Q5J8H6_9ACTN|nr:hypothetical protein [Nocardioides iriomotensis]RYU14228.1 hypothetical protein ETU37_04815 [Nocardioides iriomotensis]
MNALSTFVATIMDVVVLAARQAPEPEDVKAGWLGFAVWLGLVVAVVLLCFSFVKQLRKVNFEEKDPDAAEGGPERDTDTPNPHGSAG